MDVSIGERIKSTRQKQQLTLNGLARKSRVSKAYLSQLESGQFSNPSSEVLRKLSKTLGISIDSLVGSETLRSLVPGPSAVPTDLRALAREKHLEDEEVEMLLRISYKGRQPDTVEGWRGILEAIQKSINVR